MDNLQERVMGAEDQIVMVIEGQRRIESEVVEMRRAIVSLARIEERLASHIDGVARLGARMERVEDTVNAIEKRIDGLEQEKMRLATIVGVVAGLSGILAPHVIGWIFGHMP